MLFNILPKPGQTFIILTLFSQRPYLNSAAWAGASSVRFKDGKSLLKLIHPLAVNVSVSLCHSAQIMSKCCHNGFSYVTMVLNFIDTACLA